MQQLEQVTRSPRISGIIAALSADQRGAVAYHMARIERALKRRHKQDGELLDGLLRVLKSPLPQAQRLRDLIKEFAK